MKVIFLNRYFYPDHSATSQLASDLACYLAARGETVAVITSQQRYDDANAALPTRDVFGGVTIHRVWSTCFGRSRLLGRAFDYFSFYLFAAWRVVRLVRRDDVVVAMTDPPLISVLVWPLVKLKGAKLVNWLQDVFPEVAIASGLRVVEGAGGRLLCRLRNQSLLAAAANVVLSEGMAARIRSTPGLATLRTHVVHNWSIGDAVHPVAHAQNPLRDAWGLDGKFVVGYSGNMGRVHEFGAILDAASFFQNDGQIFFLFIGGGGRLAWIEGEVARRRLSNVIFKPYQPLAQLACSLSVPDVHLISLRREMEGLVVPSKFYGIAAAGRACIFIGDTRGDMASMIAQADCGYSVEPDDSAGLIRRIEKLRRDSTLTQAFGARATKAFNARYSRDYALGAWHDLLKDVVSNSSAS